MKKRLSAVFNGPVLAAALALSFVCYVVLAGEPAPRLRAALVQFTQPDVPALGPSEPGPTPRTWPSPATLPSLPGGGIAQHPMLYAGEGYNTIFLVNQGKVIWTYSTGRGGEIDDVWLLTNGDILYARQFHVEEVTPKKELVWHYDPPPGTEVH